MKEIYLDEKPKKEVLFYQIENGKKIVKGCYVFQEGMLLPNKNLYSPKGEILESKKEIGFNAE